MDQSVKKLNIKDLSLKVSKDLINAWLIKYKNVSTKTFI